MVWVHKPQHGRFCTYLCFQSSSKGLTTLKQGPQLLARLVRGNISGVSTLTGALCRTKLLKGFLSYWESDHHASSDFPSAKCEHFIDFSCQREEGFWGYEKHLLEHKIKVHHCITALAWHLKRRWEERIKKSMMMSLFFPFSFAQYYLFTFLSIKQLFGSVTYCV